MRGFVHYFAFLVAAFGAAAVFKPRWPPVVRQWGPAVGAAFAVVAYLTAETYEVALSLGLLAVNAVLVVYVATRSLIRFWSFNREG